MSLASNGKVGQISPLSQSDIWINGGFFVFRKELFRYINPGEELVREPFQRLIERQALLAHRTNCFWQCMDTFREKQSLEKLNMRHAPWKVWGHSSPALTSGRSNELERTTVGL